MNRKLSQTIAFTVLRISTLFVVVPVLLVMYFIISRGWRSMSWSFLSTMPAEGGVSGGISGPIIGTLILVTCTIGIALPLGLLSAIYLSEYAKPNLFTRVIRLAIVNLAGVPSIVYGLFGVGIFLLFLKMQPSILVASMTLALLILPVLIVGAEEALRSVPQGFRDASLALGATKWQTVQRIVLPNALPGIITGTILGLSRASGETAPILFTGAVALMGHMPHSLHDPFMALPYHLYMISAASGATVPEYMQWGTALTLLTIVLTMNIAAAIVRLHYRRKQVW